MYKVWGPDLAFVHWGWHNIDAPMFVVLRLHGLIRPHLVIGTTDFERPDPAYWVIIDAPSDRKVWQLLYDA